MKIVAVSGGFRSIDNPNKLLTSLCERSPETRWIIEELKKRFTEEIWHKIIPTLRTCKFYTVPLISANTHGWGWRLYGFDREVEDDAVDIIAEFIALIMKGGEMIIWLTLSGEKIYGVGIRDGVVHEIKPSYVWIPDRTGRGAHFAVYLHVAQVLREAFEWIKARTERLSSEELLAEFKKRELGSSAHQKFAQILISEWAVEWLLTNK